MIALLASAARTESAAGSAVNFDFSRLRAAIFLLTVSAAATDAGDLLDVWLQHSPDGGTTYDDFIRFTQVAGNGGAKKYLATWIRDYTPESEMRAPQDAAIAAGVVQGPIGPTVRPKWAITDGGADNASFTFKLDMVPIFDR